MRYLAIGDIHGYADVLKRLLEAIPLRSDDQVIALGDYVDRGPDSCGVIEFLLKLRERGQLVALRGNHDFMMLEARGRLDMLKEWIYCGGNSTLASYGDPSADGKFDLIPDEHWQFLEEFCVDWYEIDTHFFVHANVDPDLPLDEQPLYLLHWEPLFETRPHCSGKVMVCGHTKQRSGSPRNCGHAICLDTWVYGDGWLTCLDVKTGQFWQASRRGEFRTDWLGEPEEPFD